MLSQPPDETFTTAWTLGIEPSLVVTTAGPVSSSASVVAVRKGSEAMSIHQTRSGKWEARYREGRRNRSKTFDLEEDARAFDAEARARRQRGEHIRRGSDTPTLEDFAADGMARRAAAGLAEATLETN